MAFPVGTMSGVLGVSRSVDFGIALAPPRVRSPPARPRWHDIDLRGPGASP